VLQKAAEKAKEHGDDAGEETQLFNDPPTTALKTPPKGQAPVLVALYAAQSIEPTVEKKLPRKGKDRKYYGLLTYTMFSHRPSRNSRIGN